MDVVIYEIIIGFYVVQVVVCVLCVMCDIVVVVWILGWCDGSFG